MKGVVDEAVAGPHKYTIVRQALAPVALKQLANLRQGLF